MEEKDILDKKVVKILMKYGDKKEPNISFAEFVDAKQKGIMYDPMNYTHDELMKLVILEYQKIEKKKVIALFINSLVDGQLIKRVGLAATAIMNRFKVHKFECEEDALPIVDKTPCRICSSWYSMNTDPNIQVQLMYRSGGISGFLLSDLLLSLKLTNYLKYENINEEGIFLFKEIVNIIINSEDAESPRALCKRIKNFKIIKSNEWQIQCILETLGYCGILHNEKYRGPFYEYVNLAVAPSKRHSSDWNYPVDWWMGADGIDKEAFQYWFGELEGLKDFFP